MNKDQPIMSLAEQFARDGYLMLSEVLDEVTRQALQADYAALLDDLAARWFAEGRLPSAFSDLPFAERLTAITAHSTENLFKYLDISIAHGRVTPESPVHISAAVFQLLTHPRILDVVEALIGPEITCSPIQHVRIKPPQRQLAMSIEQSSLLSATAWHQDQGVSRPEADGTQMITVWVAITDADEANGCLTLVPGSHRAGLMEHCPADNVSIPDSLRGGDPLAVPVPAGGALFMHRLTQHASLPNTSDRIRWSFDLRYQPTGQPTGRDEFPSFIARSAAHPARVLDDWQALRAAWYAARDALVAGRPRPKTHRWEGDGPACA